MHQIKTGDTVKYPAHMWSPVGTVEHIDTTPYGREATVRWKGGKVAAVLVANLVKL